MGGQSQEYLVEMERRVSAMYFAMFALAVDDALQAHVVPLAHVAQKGAAGALEVWRRAAAAKDGPALASAQLADLEDWWSITSLASTMVHPADLNRLWLALRISPLGRAFPRLVSATHDALWKQSLGGTTLQVDWEASEVALGARTLSPRCQCASMQTRRRLGGLLARGLAAGRLQLLRRRLRRAGGARHPAG